MALASLGTTIEAIYRGAAEPETWPVALEAIADYTGTMGALLAYHDFARNEGFLVVGRLREDLTDLYLDRYGRNAYSVAITRQPAQVPFVGRALVEPEVTRRSAMYADIFAPQKITEQVMMGHAPFMQGDQTGGMAVMLDERQADRSTDVARRLARIAPHISNAIELSRTIARQALHDRRQEWLLNALPGAAFVLDGSGGLVEANLRGERLLGAGDTLRIGPGRRICARLPREERKLATLLARATILTESVPPDGLWMRMPRLGRSPVLLMVTPLPRQSFLSWDMIGRDVAILLQAYDPDETVGPATAPLLRALYGLTEAEARVAAMIGAGQSAPQTAATLGISATTVRTHLARCFDKTGARSQVALARLMASLPV